MDISLTETEKFKIVKLSGKIAWEDAQLLDSTIKDIIENQGFVHIVFNLDEVKFICSGGIGALIYNLNNVRKRDGGIYLISSNEYVNFIFDTLKFDIVFDGYLFKTYDDFYNNVVEAQKI